MPVKGFKSVTVKESVVNDLDEYAKSLGQTIPQTIEHLLENAKKNEGDA